MAETRRRIVEATVDLHGTVGPAATTISMIAERAGVQRHTLYAHFPDDRSLYLACSGLALERDPLPDATPWADIRNVWERLRQGLSAVYGWYARNDELAACVLRDAEHHALTREIAELRFGEPFAGYRRVLGAGLTRPQQALLAVALNFHAWRTLARETQLSPTAAAELFADAVASVSSSGSMPDEVDASRRRDGRRRSAVS
ncbi:MAG TPA: helix-turn-helix domain-containing protein [Steroidobacteraceae bacterium]|nr:helix-turn-helix domain-containing protein [Steroidobacteraceae bacterium]